MARDVEFLMPAALERLGGPMLGALFEAARAAGHDVIRTQAYRGGAQWLVLYGYGAPGQAAARAAHLSAGGQAILWDLGYFGEDYRRVSVNSHHPQALLDLAPLDPGRLDRFSVELREDADPAGPVVLVGLGPKTRRWLGTEVQDWEARKLGELRARFPGREVLFRPKPRRPFKPLPCRTDDASPIREVLRGASLVVCRHSNCAMDAAIAGVPFECEDGAARWLLGRPYTRENRLEFLRRLAWFQWHPSEGAAAWAFVSDMTLRREHAS